MQNLLPFRVLSFLRSCKVSGATSTNSSVIFRSGNCLSLSASPRTAKRRPFSASAAQKDSHWPPSTLSLLPLPLIIGPFFSRSIRISHASLVSLASSSIRTTNRTLVLSGAGFIGGRRVGRKGLFERETAVASHRVNIGRKSQVEECRRNLTSGAK